jgi:hypothetical protein
MPYKFGANVSNLVLMPKKTGGGGHYNFIFFLNHVIPKTGRTSGELLAFSYDNSLLHTTLFIYIYIYILCFKHKNDVVSCIFKYI